MTTQKTIKNLLGSFALASFALSVLTAQALTISPARAELTSDPGETISGTITLVNPLTVDQTYYTSVENGEGDGETGTPIFNTSKDGLPTWVKIADKIIVKKGERTTIAYTVVVPKEAESGGYFGSIFLSTVPPAAGEGEVSVGAKIGMLVFLTITGDVKEQGGLSGFGTKNGKKVFSSLPVDFKFKFMNEGNDRVKPEGAITIKNTFGMKTVEIEVNKGKGSNVLRGDSRSFSARFGDKDAPSVSAPFFEQVSFQKDNFALGMYSANLKLAFGEKGVATSKISFYIIPWQLLTVVAVVLLTIVILLVATIKHYNRWIIKQARAASK